MPILVIRKGILRSFIQANSALYANFAKALFARFYSKLLIRKRSFLAVLC